MLQQAIGTLPMGQFAERAERHMTVLINAAIAQGARDGLCRIRNVSHSGLNLETSLSLDVDAPAVVTLHSGRTLQCVVRWARDKRVGMTCAEDPAEVLQEEKALSDADRVGPALPRFDRKVAAQIVVHGVIQRCELDSLSTRDVLLTEVAPGLEAGQYIAIGIPGLGDLPATVRISDGKALFASFATPIAFADLDAWLLRAPAAFASLRR